MSGSGEQGAESGTPRPQGPYNSRPVRPRLSSFLPRIRSHQLRRGEHVAFHSSLHILFLCTGLERQWGVQCVQLEEVAVGRSRWWTGATVARATEVVAPLARPTQVERFDLGDVFRELGDGRRQIVQHPVDPGTGGSVGIIDDEGEPSRPRRRAAPAERRGHVYAVARVLGRDGGPLSERGTGERECHVVWNISQTRGTNCSPG